MFGTADVLDFPVHLCNVRCALGIPALYFCSAGSHPLVTVQDLAEMSLWFAPPAKSTV